MLQESRCYWLGERAVVLELEPPVSLSNQQRIWGLCAALRESEQVMEVVPGMNNITVILMQPELMPHAIDWLTAWWEKSASLEMENRQVNIPVVYGGEAGPDLNDVAKHCQMSANQVVEAHSAANYVVYFIGFQPGFPYLGGLDSRLHVPRRAEPRLSVPAGSVAIGGSQTGVYPLATPGGWQLIGQTTVPLFTPHAASPTYLRPGDIVRFVPQQEGVC